MEAHNVFFAPSKRKHEDDSVVDLLSNVSLSPRKKLRQDASLATIFEERPNVVTSAGLDISPPPEIDLAEEVPELSPVCPSDEKAIVLYKPIFSPAFLDGPKVASLNLPTELTSILLSRGMPDSTKVLAAPVTGDWFGGNSSIKSTDGETSEERMMSEATPDNRLAVIPWLPNSTSSDAIGFSMASNNQMATSQAETDEMGIEGSLDSEAMEEDNELVVNDSFLYNDSLLRFGTEPWQQYGVPQPQYNSVMWSH